MKKITLISSFYGAEPEVACIKEFFPSSAVILAQRPKRGNTGKIELLLKKSIGHIVDIRWVWLEPAGDVASIAKKAIETMESEHKRGQDLVINVGGEGSSVPLALLLAAYTRNRIIKNVVQAPRNGDSVIHLPKVGFYLSKSKRRVLNALAGDSDNISELAKKLGKTRGLVYVHIRKLEELGLIDKDHNLTDAGKVALL